VGQDFSQLHVGDAPSGYSLTDFCEPHASTARVVQNANDRNVIYPFERKTEVDGKPFREAKVDLKYYGDDLSRMLSLVEMMQTDLFENALIPVHLAHRYASIAHSPAGRSLDAFVREALSIHAAA
jgi:hypothetical protein